MIKSPRLFALLTFIGSLGFFALNPGVVQAQSTPVGSIIKVISFAVIGQGMFAVSWLIATIAGLVVAVEAWVLAIIFSINTQIVNAPAVQLGFPIVLQIANLFFVLGIIVIAIATILRFEKYGVKQILWKLMVMAILVNFGLVICAPILNFSDSIAIFFLDAINPLGGTLGNATGVAGSWSNFGIAIAGAFNPQTGFILNKNCARLGTSGTSAFAQLGNDIGQMIAPIASLLFVIISLVSIVIILFVLTITLLHRYVELSILLVLLPLAWASWAFPSFSSNYHKWWSRFAKQLFYPPLVIFFLWLGIQTSYSMAHAFPTTSCATPAGPELYLKNRDLAMAPRLNAADMLGIKMAHAADTATSTPIGGTYDFQAYVSSDNPGYAPFQGFLDGLFSPIIENFLRTLVILGIMSGGIVASKEMGVKGFELAEKGIGAVTGGIKGWAAGKAVRLGTRPLRGERMERFRARLGRPGATALTNALRKPLHLLGEGLGALNAIGGAQQVEKAKKDIASWDSRRIAENMAGMTNVKRMAAIDILKERGHLKMVKEVTGQDVARWMIGRKGEFERFGQGEKLEEAWKRRGVSEEMLEAGAVLDKDPKNADALKKLAEATKVFATTLSREDAAKIELNHLFGAGGKFNLSAETIRKLREAFLFAVAKDNEQLVSAMLPKTKGDSAKTFKKEYGGGKNEQGNYEDGALDRLPEGPEKEEKKKRWKTTVAHNVTGGGHEEHEDHPAPAAPAAQQTPAATPHPPAHPP